jgi:hypothetical protein
MTKKSEMAKTPTTNKAPKANAELTPDQLKAKQLLALGKAHLSAASPSPFTPCRAQPALTGTTVTFRSKERKDARCSG